MKLTNASLSFLTLCSLIFLSLFAPMATVFAQSATSLPGPNVSLTASTNTPAPGQAITLTVQSYATDLTRATITWYVNDKKILSGIGQTTYSLTTGNQGSSLTVSVDVLTEQGETVTQSISFHPASVDMVWQAKSYTPPFYEGKALFPYQGTVVVSAIPSFTSNTKNAVYTWSENGTVLGSQSGYGKDSVIVSQPIIARPINITVQVSSLDGTLSGQNGVTIPTASPDILFYTVDPTYGVQYQNAIASSFNLGSGQVELQAAPYFFDSSRPGDDSAVTYDWSINSTEVASNQNGKKYLAIQKPNVTGQAIISLKATNANKILQFQTTGLTINF